jgi:hypothetical protein
MRPRKTGIWFGGSISILFQAIEAAFDLGIRGISRLGMLQ